MFSPPAGWLAEGGGNPDGPAAQIWRNRLAEDLAAAVRLVADQLRCGPRALGQQAAVGAEVLEFTAGLDGLRIHRERPALALCRFARNVDRLAVRRDAYVRLFGDEQVRM